MERALVQLVPGSVRVKPPSLHFSGTRVSFVVISSQNVHVQNEHSRFQLAEFIHSQCQNIQRMVSPLLGVPATLTVIPNLGFHETLLGRRMMLGKGESTCCSYHASAVALVSIPDSSTSVDRPESIGANTPSDSKHRPVPIYILTNCNGRPTTFALDSIGTAVVTVLSEKIDWDSYGFALRKTSSCPLELSEAGGGEAYDCVQCTSLPIGPVQPESQCAVDAIAVRVVVRTKGKVNPITSKRLITSVKKAVDEALLDIKSSCPTAAMADGRERSIARAVPIISRSLLTSILGRSAQKKFSSEEEFQTRIFNLLSMALDENKNNKKARVEINY